MEVRVEPDAGRAWLAYVFWLVRTLPVGIILGVAAVGSGGLSWGVALVGTLFLVLVTVVGLGTLTALWWRLRAGRVVYEVREGQLLIGRGESVLRRFRCAEVTGLAVFGALTWKELLLRNWFNYEIEGWPRLVVDVDAGTSTRLTVASSGDQPGILLWGDERARRAARDLRAAVAANGATLRN